PVGTGRTVRPDQVDHVPVGHQVSGLDAGLHPEVGHPGHIGVGEQLSVLDPTTGTGGSEGVQRHRARSVADRVDRRGDPGRRCPLAARSGAPASPRPNGSWHHAVRVFNDPSLITFRYPIVSRSPPPGSRSPVHSPASIAVVSRSGHTLACTRWASNPAATRRRQASWLSPGSKSVIPTTPSVAAA